MAFASSHRGEEVNKIMIWWFSIILEMNNGFVKKKVGGFGNTITELGIIYFY